MERLKIRDMADFLSGLLFIALGLLGLMLALDYDMGTLRRMGPGFFPAILCGILTVLGVATVLISLGLRDTGDEPGAALAEQPFADLIPALRATFFVIAALVVFALSVRRIGLVLSVMALVFIASFADRSLGWIETVIIGAVMSFVAVAVFRWGIGLPFPVWP